MASAVRDVVLKAIAFPQLVQSARNSRSLHSACHSLREQQAPVGMTIHEWDTAIVKLLQVQSTRG